MSKWVSLEEREPSCYISGNFDGLKSEPLLCVDKDGVMRVAVVYKGVLDGSRFCCFYTIDDYEIENVTHWQPLPPPPHHHTPERP